MPYTIVDLLDKFISIEHAGYKMYMEIIKMNNVPEKIKTIARVFAIEEEKHIETYKQIKNKMESEPNIEVDLHIYDKASTLIYQFSKLNKISDLPSSKSLLEFCLEFEKSNLALLLSIRGILIRTTGDEDSVSYKAISELVDEEYKHIKNIEYFIGEKEQKIWGELL